MDINIVIKRTAVYSLSAGLLASFFVVFVLAMTKYLSNLAGITSFTITVIAALIIALLFNPLRNRIQTIIDKIFYKKTYDYYATIQKVSHELASTFNLRKIYSFVGDTIFSTLGLKNIYLLFAIPGGSYRTVYSTSHGKDKAMEDEEAMEIDEESKMVKYLMDSEDVVIREELPHISKISQEVTDNVNADLKPFKGEVVVPVSIGGKLELLMVLGEKLSGDIFTVEDIRLLKTISEQTAIAIKNARLYIDKLRSERFASIGMVSATFAHEIKNPLSSIKTFAQLLPDRYSDIDFRENFSKIVMDSVNHIDSLITDLMGLSSGRLSAGMSTLNITGLIDQIIDEIRANLELEKKKIKIEKDYKDIKIDILGDEKRLRQAFINIITNGCQAIPDGRDDGTLRVSINQDNENVDILITDNGDGIPAEDVPKIFNPFFSTKTIGAGLGLAITKKIIEDHSGKIEVESRLKKGTTFKITLPKEIGAKGETLSTT
jgi:signal transduction histidine kinase